MRLLVVNFEMDRLSPSMPWSASIVDALAGSCEKVVVLTSRVGDYAPPANVVVETIPFPRLIALPPARPVLAAAANAKAWSLIRRHRLDACFVHMAAHWAWYLAPTFKALNVPVMAWYAHGAVTPELKRVLWAADRIVTSTLDGFRLSSDKVRVIGQGVDTGLFRPSAGAGARDTVVSVSRISPRKRLELLLDMMEEIGRRPGAPPVKLLVIGGPVSREDAAYDRSLREEIWRRGLEKRVTLAGYVPQARMPRLYEDAFVHLNVSATGSMDKTVLEALACGCPVITSNGAFREIFRDRPQSLLSEDGPAALADAVLAAHARREDPAALRALVEGRHDQKTHVARLLENLRDLAARRHDVKGEVH